MLWFLLQKSVSACLPCKPLPLTFLPDSLQEPVRHVWPCCITFFFLSLRFWVDIQLRCAACRVPTAFFRACGTFLSVHLPLTPRASVHRGSGLCLQIPTMPDPGPLHPPLPSACQPHLLPGPTTSWPPSPSPALLLALSLSSLLPGQAEKARRVQLPGPGPLSSFPGS